MKKAQLSLSDAPTVVMTVGLTFLVFATLAYIAYQYGSSMPSDITGTVINETLTSVDEKGEIVSNASKCNFESFAVTQCFNSTNGVLIGASNYSATTSGKISYIVATNAKGFNNSNWKCSYTFKHAGAGCEVTTSLNTEIENNTSILGITLTIGLISIILSVLIGIFVMSRNKGL